MAHHHAIARLRYFIPSLLGALALLGGCQDKISDKDLAFVSLSEVRAATTSVRSGAQLIDPRSADDFAAGHIPGAENVQLQQIPDSRHTTLDPRLARAKMLIVYADNPGSGVAPAMAKRLMRVGASKVRVFSGGLDEWSKAGYPVSRLAEPANEAPESAEAGR